MPAIRCDALAERPREIGLGPAADPGGGVRRDIGRVYRAERSLERQTARKGRAARPRMAADAIPRRSQIVSLLRRLLIRLGAVGAGDRGGRPKPRRQAQKGKPAAGAA
jgi:hypothetical protein